MREEISAMRLQVYGRASERVDSAIKNGQRAQWPEECDPFMSSDVSIDSRFMEPLIAL